MVRQLDDKQYSDTELIEVKLPLHLPYLSNWNDYERIDGEMEYNGIYYNYVKRKVCNDTLFLLCLPNQSKTRFYHARHEYARQVNGAPSRDNNDKPLVKKINITTEYNQPLLQFSFTCWAEPVGSPHYNLVARLIHPFIDAQYRPPQVL